jgi:hypothetical protein
MEYQFFFRARGALRRPSLNRLIAIVCMAEVLVFFMAKYENEDKLPILGSLWKAANFQEELKNVMDGYCQKYTRFCTIFEEYFFQVFVIYFALFLFTVGKLMLNLVYRPQHHPGSVWSSLAAILLLGPCLFLETSIPEDKLKVPRLIFIPLLAAVILVAISKLQFQRITALVNSPTGRRMISKSPVIMIFCVCTAVAILGNMAGVLVYQFLLLALLVETCGNLEVLAAVVRIQYAMMGFIKVSYGYPEGTSEPTKKNFMHSRAIFYRMVLVEGALCILACILETFSSIPRKSLLHQSGFGSKWGVKCIDMYYSRVYEQCIAGGVLAPKITQLTSFAMDFTNSDSASNQLYGVQMLHSFLQKEPSKALLLSRLSTSMKTVQTLISMLGWASPQNAAIRLFAAKVINDLANNLEAVAIPGSMQNISSLLGTDNQMKRQSPLLYTYGNQEERQDIVLDIGDDEEDRQDPLVHTSSRRNSRMLRSRQWMTTCWSIEEELFTDQELLPVLGMSILERLADCGPENSEEICSANNLISKIIEYTNEIHDQILKGSSLKLLRRLSITGGEIGITLRRKISEQPCLLRTLAEILDDMEGSQELKKLATEILRNLATDRNTREEIVHIGVITSRLIHAFLAQHPPSNPYSDRSLQITAGQALALLTMESVNNCSLMLKEPGYELIRELIVMIQDDRYNRYVAAIILRNLCMNAQPIISSSDMAELSHFLRKVRPASSCKMFNVRGVQCNLFSLIFLFPKLAFK